MIYSAVADLPTTLGGWIAVLVGVVVIASTVGGLIVKLGSRHIDERVRREVHVQVPAVVAVALREVNAKLDGIRINQAELSSEVAVVRRLEVQINNGFATRVQNIEDRQSGLIEHVAEMHGWMKASNQWNGDDRRTP